MIILQVKIMLMNSLIHYCYLFTQPAIIRLRLARELLEQGVKYIQS